MSPTLALGIACFLFSNPALAQEPPEGPTTPITPPDGAENFPKKTPTGVKVTPNWVNWEIGAMMRYFAQQTDVNLVVEDERNLKDTITVIGNKPVPIEQAYEAFLMALEAKGYTTVTAAGFTRIIKADTAGQMPIVVSDGEYIPDSFQYITQIVPLENVSVSDVDKIVSSMIGPQGKYIQYVPTNTFIITDSGVNLRKLVGVLKDLDVAAPKSTLEIVALRYAQASEVQTLIEQLYGTVAGGTTEATPQATSATRRRNRRRPQRDAQPDTAAATSSGTKAGAESKYISKVLAEERTNSLIVLANEQGHAAVKDLLAKVDVDVDMTSRSQIHVIYLEHAKAEDVSQVLSNLSQSGSGGSNSRSGSTTRRTPTATRGSTATNARAGAAANAADSGGTGVVAAFDSGMRITHDENTNSLVIIASPEDFRVVKGVIDDLDVRRRQVYVDAVILEISSEDELDFGIAYHGPANFAEGTAGVAGGQFNATSIGGLSGLSQDLLSGLALGVFGPELQVPITVGGQTQNIGVPAFGVVLNALKTNSSVNIVSNPNLLTLDNEEAKIVVGKKIPFPTSSGINNLTGQPIVSYQREDVAITLQLTPRVNSTDFVTLELLLEVAEIEEDNQGLNQNTAGFITSKREVETTALVGDNQTVVLGGLMGSTTTDVETKVPILGDLPLIGALFRGSRTAARRTNLMIFLTPHIIDDNEDMMEVMQVKEAQRQEFLRRFYGRSQEDQQAEMRKLLRFSMNTVDAESQWRDPAMKNDQGWEDGPTEDVRDAIDEGIEDARDDETLPDEEPG